jgi:hypothetical protein
MTTIDKIKKIENNISSVLCGEMLFEMNKRYNELLKELQNEENRI